jgi:hypothetical protein
MYCDVWRDNYLCETNLEKCTFTFFGAPVIVIGILTILYMCLTFPCTTSDNLANNFPVW